MKILLKGKETEVKFTFNSFKYMQDFDINEVNEVETKPFKVIPIIDMLMLGGLNHNPKVIYSESAINDFMEKYVETGSIGELLENLMKELQDSNFFKSLQRTAEKKAQ